MKNEKLNVKIALPTVAAEIVLLKLCECVNVFYKISVIKFFSPQRHREHKVHRENYQN